MSTPTSASGQYRTVWRWHLLAALFVAPFAVFLSLTGALYLWKPQYEAWRYRELLQVEVKAGVAELPADRWLELAQAAVPGFTPRQVVPPSAPGRSVEVVFGPGWSGDRSVFLHPQTGELLGVRLEEERLMSLIHDLHGSLLAGKTGEVLVELAASWAFIMILTGLYLWWPRPFRWGGTLYPRLGQGRRTFLKDLHAVPAFWCSGATLLLLATGMPWTTVSGAWIRQIAQWTGEWQPPATSASAHRSELLGGWSPYLADRTQANAVAQVASAPSADAQPRRLSLDAVRAIAAREQVTDAYAIALPRGEKGVYSVLSDRNRAFTRTYLHLDQYSGKVLADVRYRDFGSIAKFFTFGIILHEGQLFGLANQVGGTLAALGVVAMSLSGLYLWWSRRPPGGGLALPKPGDGLPRFLVLGFAVCALLAPLFAASLALLLLGRWLILKRLPSSP